MNCTLSTAQKKVTRQTVAKLLKVDKISSPEDILINTYHVVYEAFMEKGMSTDARPYGLAMAQYAAQILDEEIAGQDSDVRRIIADLFQEKHTLTKEHISKYNSEAAIKELLGLKEHNLHQPKNLSKADVQVHLDKFTSAFSKVGGKVRYTTNIMPISDMFARDTWDFTVAEDSEGNQVKLIGVTDFIKHKTNKSKYPSNNKILEGGTLVDLAIRKFFQNPMDYEKFKLSMAKDSEFVKEFTAFSSSTGELAPSEIVDGYMLQFLDDIIFAINYIQTNYPDTYITDLQDIIPSTVVEGQGNKKIIYNTGLGIRGELDLIAIKADGTFTVIDLKTTQKLNLDKIPDSYKVPHSRQASIYTLIVEKGTGLKSTGKSDVIYLTRIIANPAKTLLRDVKGNYKISITDFKRESFDNVNEGMLALEVQQFHKTLTEKYNEILVAPISTTPTKSKAFNPFLAAAMARKKKDPLPMTLIEADPQSTYESLVAGKKWIHARFPELSDAAVPIIRMANTVNGGEFFLDTIKLFEKSNIGVAYHEGWHRFSQLYMTIKEKIELYNSVKKDNITFTDRKDRKLSTSTATLLEVEEFLAEEFKKYALDTTNYKYPTENTEPKTWFQKIWEAIKSIASYFKKKGTLTPLELFKQLNTGTFNRSNYATKNAIFHQLNSIHRSTSTGMPLLDNMSFLKLRDLADFKIADYLRLHDKTIIQFLTKEGADKIHDLISESIVSLYNGITDYRDQLEVRLWNTPEEEDKKILREEDKSLSHLEGTLGIVLDVDYTGEYKNFQDFLRAFYKTTNFESLRLYSNQYQKGINKLVEEESLMELVVEQREQEADEDSLGEFDDETSSEEDNIFYNNPGNTLQAIDNARASLKDFFNGIRRRKDTEIKRALTEEDYVLNSDGLPTTLNKVEAFYKTLNVLQGSLTLSNMITRLNTDSYYKVFPELAEVREKLLGVEDSEEGAGDGHEGIIFKFIRLSITLKSQTATAEEIQEHGTTMAFLQHFAHVMSLRKVDFEALFINLNATASDITQTRYPVVSKNNLESIIFSIMNDFSKGFQENKKKETKEGKPSANIYDVMYNIFSSAEGIATFQLNGVSNTSLYDAVNQKYYFNAKKVSDEFSFTSEPNDETLQKFFEALGINLNKEIYANNNDNTHPRRMFLQNTFNTLKDILALQHNRSYEKAINIARNTNISAEVKEWARLKEMANNPNLSPIEKALADTRLLAKEVELNKFIYQIFPDNPVNEMLFDGRDLALRKNPAYKLFAANLPIFQELANLEKNYHKRYSSGSLTVMGKLQYAHFLPSTLLLTEMLLNEHVHSASEFNKYKELSHLDPTVNPQIWNSQIFSRLFNKENGDKTSNMKLKVVNLSQVSIAQGDFVESKGLSELKEDEKMLVDYLMMRVNGRAEMRRIESSNSSPSMGLSKTDGIKDTNIKLVELGTTGNFTNPSFLSIIRGYMQHAAWKYKYNLNSDNAALDINYQKDINGVSGMHSLGVFDEMLGNTVSSEIKSFIKKTKDQNLNNLMDNIEKENPELFKKINYKIAEYFEAITITNEDSYTKAFHAVLSTKSRQILSDLSTIEVSGKPIVVMKGDMIIDSLMRDFIANDFILAMEDAILFFGDYSYYKDPIKRRKIIGNNGSIHMIDDILAQGIEAQKVVNSLSGVYQQFKGITSTKDHQLIRKQIVKDVKMVSKLLDKNENGEEAILRKLQMVNEQSYGIEKTIAELRIEKKETINAFENLEIADAAAWISLDTYRLMRMREETWDWDLDEREYMRQQYILADKLGKEITPEQREIINKGSISAFNVAKFALTGAVYLKEHSPYKPVFDKMGLRVLLPEMDWDNNVMGPLFEKMLEEDIDYYVTDTGSKGYKPPIKEVFSKDALTSLVNPKSSMGYIEHAGGYFKHQLNTSSMTDKSSFSIQLRSIFYELMLVEKKMGKKSPKLSKAYHDFLQNLVDYIAINSSRALGDMGLNNKGQIINKAIFTQYLTNRLLDIGELDPSLIDELSVNADGDFVTYLEALPFQKNMMDLIAGVIDDNFRKIKLNGSKLYQSPEVGTTNFKTLREDRGTIELKWHDLEIVDGKVISTTPVEAKINFRSQFKPLLKLRHPDGKKIDNISRLNEALRDEAWVKTYKDSITFIGVRIPLQDINFNSHIIIKEFLTETTGDIIILPPEFYKQTGGDNDIDTITATFKYLDDNGRPIKRPTMEYAEILKQINSIVSKLSINNFNTSKLSSTQETQLTNLRLTWVKSEIYSAQGYSEQDFENDFTVVEKDGYKTFRGKLNKTSLLYKLSTEVENSAFNSELDEVDDYISRLNQGKKITVNQGKKIEVNQGEEIKEDNLITLNNLNKQKLNYLKGITNDIVSSLITFAEAPENFDLLTETDSMSKIEQMAKNNIARLTGVDATTLKLNEQMSSLKSMTYASNVRNHVNNFEIRSMLGAIVKYRSMLTLLAQSSLVLDREFVGGSRINLLAKGTDPLTSKDKVYARTFRTPLLYTKDTSNGIAISIFDENGERITKNLSMLSSTLLDLFKNPDTFPSLGISWLNIKALIVLTAQGVPLERAILFLNNPMIKGVEDKLKELGSTARDRHAVVAFTQGLTIEENFLFPVPPPSQISGEEKLTYGLYRPIVEVNGKQVPDPMLLRPAKAAEKYLKDKKLSFSEETLVEFTEAYTKYLEEHPLTAWRNVKSFLKKHPEYTEVSRDIIAYYATLLEDGELFYANFIKGLGRASIKTNSMSAVYNAQDTDKVREATRWANTDFEKNIKEGPLKAFYNDDVIENILSNLTPHLLNNPDTYFTRKFKAMLKDIISKTHGTQEDKRKVEMRVISDFIYAINLNFFVYTNTNKDGDTVGNFLYEFFDNDITPLLSVFTGLVQKYKQQEEAVKADLSVIASEITEDDRIQKLYGENLFSHQIDFFLGKYPELGILKTVSELMTRKDHPVNPETTNRTDKDVRNALSQSSLIFNLSSNPKDKQVDETIIRDEFPKLINFDINSFPELVAKLELTPERLEFYQRLENKAEISQLFQLLSYYFITQASHLDKARGSYSYLAPIADLKNVTTTAIDNFNKFLKEAGSVYGGRAEEKVRRETIDSFLTEWEKMFRDMNGELNWSNTPNVKKQDKALEIDEVDMSENVEEYFVDKKKEKQELGRDYGKSHTGKLYSKMGLLALKVFKENLLKDAGVTDKSINTFKIKRIDTEDDNLNCNIS